MKTLVKTFQSLHDAGRWDIDFHLPPIGITRYDQSILARVDEVADIAATKRNPSKEAEAAFLYIDISCVDSGTGMVGEPQELLGEEAPSRARKVVQAFDVLVSTVRPTRGAIAVVPPYLHNQVASTGFTVLRPTQINALYLQFALRLPSTREQFRKWSTGSSYPAILDEDVAKTLIPVPDDPTQDEIAARLSELFLARADLLTKANATWDDGLVDVARALAKTWDEGEATSQPSGNETPPLSEWLSITAMRDQRQVIEALPELTLDVPARRSRGRGAE